MLRLSRALVSLALVGCAEVDPEGEPATGEATQALETYPNEEPAFNFFIGKGLTPVQSAGIVGNLDVESGVDPTIQSPGGKYRGIAQWGTGARWDTTNNDNVVDYAAEQGKSATSLGLQLDFIWYELTNFSSYGLSHLQDATTTTAAVAAFSKYYEGCGSCDNATRKAHADSVIERFGDGTGNTSSSGSEPPPDPDACTLDNGDTGTCMDVADCAAMGDHVSSPGFCPGASSNQCCTAVAGASSSSSGGKAPTTSSSGGSKGSSGASGNDDDDGDTNPGADPLGRDDGGCSSSPARAGDWSWLALAGLAGLVSRRRARA